MPKRNRTVPKPKRRANRGERTIITIHGIRTDGEWQGLFETVFDPHFHYESFKYSEFKNSFGAIFLLGLEWVALILVLLALVLEWRLGWLNTLWLPWVANGFCIVSVLWLARILAEGRRARVVSSFVNFVDEAVGGGRAPHVVAHSLGSFILGRTLFRFPEFYVGKIVLLGCVLTPKFRWDTLRRQFDLVRNELGARDPIGTIAAILAPFVPELGPSGKHGFTDPAGSVEKFPRDIAGAPWRPCVCGTCPGGNSNWAVLNVDGQGIGHSDLTHMTLRARTRWLPYFWDIPPDHFQRFKELCLECDTLEENESPDLNGKVSQLLGDCWFWSQGPLEDFLRRYFGALQVEASETTLRTAATNLFRTIAAATRATTVGEQRYLHPLLALRYAVQRARERGA